MYSEKDIRLFLEKIRNKHMSIKEGLSYLKHFSFEEKGFAKIDHNRHLRRGFPEVIYAPGKEYSALVEIIQSMMKMKTPLMISKVSPELFTNLSHDFPELIYYAQAKIVCSVPIPKNKSKTKPVCIVTAGTSDIPIAEEANITCQFAGINTKRIYDVGVAGIHRLTPFLATIKRSKVIIVVAGMEGALASVIGGVTSKSIIAVPTSVGYGASFQGLSALLTMLNSCSPGVAVVNIDNGFGAGYFASTIVKHNKGVF